MVFQNVINRPIHRVRQRKVDGDVHILRREGIGTVGELVQRTGSDLMAIRNFGRKSLQEVKDKLAGMDLTLAVEPDEVVVDDETEDEDYAE